MRIDLLRPLVPSEYRFRQDLLDTMFAIAKSNPMPTCHQDEIVRATNAKKEKIEAVILYLVRNDYAKWVGNHGEPLYALTEKGQTASIDGEFLRTGRDDANKTFQAYSGRIGLIGTLLGILSMTLSLLTRSDLSKATTEQEKRLEEIERHISDVSASSTNSSSAETRQVAVDSVSSSRDSAMLRTAVIEKPSP